MVGRFEDVFPTEINSPFSGAMLNFRWVFEKVKFYIPRSFSQFDSESHGGWTGRFRFFPKIGKEVTFHGLFLLNFGGGVLLMAEILHQLIAS